VFEAPDLDGRPGTMLRETMNLWVQRCPGCHACWADLSQVPQRASRVVRSAEYQQVTSNPETPELARSFLAEALLAVAADAHGSAARSTLCAAWVCDDAGDERVARECRELAVERLRTALGAEGGHWPQAIASRFTMKATLLDVLRRLRRFDEASQLAAEIMPDAASKRSQQLLWYQQQRIAAKDSERHTEDDATRVGSTAPDTRRPRRLLDENDAVRYVWQYHEAHLSPAERAAARASLMNFRGEPRWDVDSPDAEALLADGADEFARRLIARLERDHSELIFNRCPQCAQLARTPTARQCRYCGHSWRSAGASK